MQEITRSTAIQRARNYRNAKQGFQTAIYWAVNQAMNGNADGLYLIMLHAGMLNGKGGEMTRLADGRQLWSYWQAPTEQGGLGLRNVLEWDKAKTKFKMVSLWRTAVDDLDVSALHVALTTTLWSKFESAGKEPPPFDLEKVLAALIKKAGNNGLSSAKVAETLIQMTGYDPAVQARKQAIENTPAPVEPAPVEPAPVEPAKPTRKPRAKKGETA